MLCSLVNRPLIRSLCEPLSWQNGTACRTIINFLCVNLVQGLIAVVRWDISKAKRARSSSAEKSSGKFQAPLCQRADSSWQPPILHKCPFPWAPISWAGLPQTGGCRCHRGAWQPHSSHASTCCMGLLLGLAEMVGTACFGLWSSLWFWAYAKGWLRLSHSLCSFSLLLH